MGKLKGLLNNLADWKGKLLGLNIFYLFYALLLNERVYKWIRAVEFGKQKNFGLALLLLIALIVELPAIWIKLTEARQQGVKIRNRNAGVFIIILLVWAFHVAVSSVVLITFVHSLGFSVESWVGTVGLSFILIREFALLFMIIIYKDIPARLVSPRIRLLAELCLLYVTSLVYTRTIFPMIAPIQPPLPDYKAVAFSPVNPLTVSLPYVLFLLALQILGFFIVFVMFYIPYRFVYFLKAVFSIKKPKDFVKFFSTLISAYVFLVIPVFIRILFASPPQNRTFTGEVGVIKKTIGGDKNFTYPQIKGMKNAAVQSTINRELKKRIIEARAGGAKNENEILGKIKASYSFLKFKVTYNQKGLLSLVTYSEYLSYRPIPEINSYNINLGTGKFIGLADIFDRKGIEKMDGLVKRKLKDGYKNEVEECAQNLEEIVQEKVVKRETGFYIKKDSLVIPVFLPGSVPCPLEVEILWEEVKPLLNPASKLFKKTTLRDLAFF